MNHFVIHSIFCVIFVSSIALAETPAPLPAAPPVEKPESARSTPDKHFWVSATVGLIGSPTWGVNTEGGLGYEPDLSLRYQFGRCGALIDWHIQNIQYTDPATIRNSIWGAGAACRITTFGDKNRFWHGTHLLARAMVEYGQAEYHIYDWTPSDPDAQIANGMSYGWGGLVGADLMVPIFYGFWGMAGTGIEELKFNYLIPSTAVTARTTSNPTLNFFARVGVSFGF